MTDYFSPTMSKINKSNIINNSQVKKEIDIFDIVIEKDSNFKEDIENEDIDDIFDEALQRKIKSDPANIDEQLYAGSTANIESNTNCKENKKFWCADRMNKTYLDAKKLVVEEMEHNVGETKDDLSIKCLTEENIELDISCKEINEKLYAVDEENGNYFPITILHKKQLAAFCKANEKVYVIDTTGENDMLANSGKGKICKRKVTNTFKNSYKVDDNVYIIDYDKPTTVKYLEKSVERLFANNDSNHSKHRVVECLNGSDTGTIHCSRDDICIISDDENNSLKSEKSLKDEPSVSDDIIILDFSKEAVDEITDGSNKKNKEFSNSCISNIKLLYESSFKKGELPIITERVKEDTDDIFDEEREKREKELLKKLKLCNNKFKAEGSEIQNGLQQETKFLGEEINNILGENNESRNSIEVDKQKSGLESCNRINVETGKSNDKCNKNEISLDIIRQGIELEDTIMASTHAIVDKITNALKPNKPQNKNNNEHDCLKTSKQRTVNKNNTGLKITSNASKENSGKLQTREYKANNLKIGKQNNPDERRDIECNNFQYCKIKNKSRKGYNNDLGYESQEKTKIEERNNKFCKTSHIRPKSGRITQKTKCICACNNVKEGNHLNRKKIYPKANVDESDKKANNSEKLKTKVYSSLHSEKNKAKKEYSSRNHEKEESHAPIVVTNTLFEKFYEDIIKNKSQVENRTNIESGYGDQEKAQSNNMVNDDSMMDEIGKREIRYSLTTETEKLKKGKYLKKNMKTYELHRSSEDLFKTKDKIRDLSCNSNLLKQLVVRLPKEEFRKNRVGNYQGIKRDHEECLKVNKKNDISGNENVLKGSENQSLSVNEAIRLINGILTKIADGHITDKTIYTLIENIEDTVKKQNYSISENTDIVKFAETLSNQYDVNDKDCFPKIEKGLDKHDTNNSFQSGNKIILCKNSGQETDEFNKIEIINCDKISQKDDEIRNSINVERKKINSKRKAIINYDPNKKVKLENNMLPYSCTECPYQSYSKKYFNNHIIIHSKVIIKCDFCHYFTNVQRNLVSHMKVHLKSNEVKMFECPDCSYRTKRIDRLKIHLVLHKRPENMFKCDKCPYQSKRKSNLKRHQVYQKCENELVLFCSLCSFKTKRKKIFNSHMIMHKKVKLYKCDQCFFSTKDKKGLYTHHLVHKQLDEIKTYDCLECSYRAKSKEHLKQHSLLHKMPGEVELHNCD